MTTKVLQGILIIPLADQDLTQFINQLQPLAKIIPDGNVLTLILSNYKYVIYKNHKKQEWNQKI